MTLSSSRSAAIASYDSASHDSAPDDSVSERIRIIGTGPVSLTLRGLLARQGFDDAQIDYALPTRALPAWLANRAIALSLGSWQLLGRLCTLPPSAPIRDVEVSLSRSIGRTRLKADELNAPVLGHVVRYEDLHRALLDGLGRRTLAPQVRHEESRHAHRPAESRNDNQDFALTIVADGDPGDDAQTKDFGQSAVVASLRSQRAAPGIAFERFTVEGPLALLPLPGERLWSVVWCAPTSIAQERAALPAPSFEKALRAAFGAALGEFECIDRPIVVSLQRKLRTRLVDERRIAIGNAAQALHPVAGQGLNLGLRDAFVLAQALGDARAARRALASALGEFEAQRRRDRIATVEVTDTLASIFTIPALRPAQSFALGMLDLLPGARGALSRAFMFGLRS